MVTFTINLLSSDHDKKNQWHITVMEYCSYTVNLVFWLRFLWQLVILMDQFKMPLPPFKKNIVFLLTSIFMDFALHGTFCRSPFMKLFLFQNSLENHLGSILVIIDFVIMNMEKNSVKLRFNYVKLKKKAFGIP